jgi:alpha-N-acetylglucosaminidase
MSTLINRFAIRKIIFNVKFKNRKYVHWNHFRQRFITVMAMTVFCHVIGFTQFNTNASLALINRVIPGRGAGFEVEYLRVNEKSDVFEIESRNNKIVLRGNNGVAIASALYFYLTHFCHCQITWNGTNLNIPKTLPGISKKIRQSSPYQYRYYLNYCTFNYSISWWNWERWEKEIDWMALHGINMPLAITGEEFIWYTVYKEMGFSDEDLQSFFSGPAYFSWFWMGNLDGWGGPLPVNWMKSHMELQKKILQRERELGMKPVLPAFSGHVPETFKKKFPNARLKATNWKNGFEDTYVLDPEDSLFAYVGKRFLKTQTKLFGTDHLYSADTFNENEPPSDDTNYLAKLSRTLYQSMYAADPASTWVMQGWLFYSDRKFWKAPQIKALLNAVPDKHMILLDLAAEIEPVWKRTNAFYGKPWIWNMVHNFGGNISMFGRLEGVAGGPAEALNDKSSGHMVGIGLTMEGIEQNPVMYELLTQHVWQNEPIDLKRWLDSYIVNRYGILDSNARNAWEILRSTAYNGKIIRDGAESIITGRPTFDSATVWTKTKLNYDPKDFLPAWDLMMAAVDHCKNIDGFQYDLVDITRQVLANYADLVHAKLVNAYRDKDRIAYKKYCDEFLQIITDMDSLLGTKKDFLLGLWISDARSFGNSMEEKALYERNARDLITLWGDKNSPLHEYSCRQWSGLLNDFYRARWKIFFEMSNDSLNDGKNFDPIAFDKYMRDWEWQWVNTRKDYPTEPSGNSIDQSISVYRKYYNEMKAAY